jgi:hypothetical protein
LPIGKRRGGIVMHNYTETDDYIRQVISRTDADVKKINIGTKTGLVAILYVGDLPQKVVELVEKLIKDDLEAPPIKTIKYEDGNLDIIRFEMHKGNLRFKAYRIEVM